MPKNEWLPIWESRPYPPLLMSLVTDSTVFGFKKIFPQSRISRGADFWQNGESNYLYLNSEIEATVSKLAALALDKPSAFFKFFKIAYRKGVSFNNNSRKFRPSEIKKLSDEKLIKAIFSFTRDFYDFYSYATMASWFGYNQDNPLYGKMNEILRQKTATEPQKFAVYLVILTNPPKLLKTNHLELSLLKLALKAKRLKAKSAAQIKKRLPAELSAIVKKYQALSFDFTDKLGWDLDHFAALVSEKTKLNIAVKIREINNYERKANKDYYLLCKKLSLTEAEIKIFNLVRYLGYYKWAREYEFQEGLYYYKSIPDELGRRSGLNTLQAKYILPKEWKNLLKNPALARKLSSARIKNCLYVSQWGKKSRLFTGPEAVRQYKKISLVKQGVFLNSKELKGTPAFAGVAKGKVKIVNVVKDLKKMNRGDILVSAATQPDLLPAMKKAAAIITDEGGITCHAAIVSRELKIPCIVGTKFAAKVLKDGEMVQVDANRGIVRIIKSI